MYKLFISIKKELLLLINDKVGLLLMFAMPLLLVIIITIIQDSAFKIVNNNSIKLLVANKDKGAMGDNLISLLEASNMFLITKNNELDSAGLQKEIQRKNTLTALLIHPEFSKDLEQRAEMMSANVLRDFGLVDSVDSLTSSRSSDLLFYHDPALQENYCHSIIKVLGAHVRNVESQQMIESFYAQMGVPVPERENIASNDNVPIKRVSTTGKTGEIPNSTQHNVPAWTVFAMFFMVVSLGSNIVKERTLGSFMRLKTMPTNFGLVLLSKQLVYVAVAILQVCLIFSVGYILFPIIELPEMTIPGTFLKVLAVTLMCSFAAVSYALLIGTLTKTHEQANGAGAVSIIIFAALGGVWVPTFAMPDYLQILSKISPLHWCLEGYYSVFLKNSAWIDITYTLGVIALFSVVCQAVSFVKLRMEKLV